MKTSMIIHRGRLIAVLSIVFLALGAFAVRFYSTPAAAASAVQMPPLLPWTAVASTGAVDEDSLAHFAFGGPRATYRSTSQSVNPLTFRYNVTNPGHDTYIPGWGHLFLNSHVLAAGSEVRATLFRVDPCTGEETALCTTINNQITEQPRCTSCEFAPASINFQPFLYYVRIEMDRNDQPDPPVAYSVHLRP